MRCWREAGLLDRPTWTTSDQLGNAVFAHLEVCFNSRRRHSALDYPSPADFETAWHRRRLVAAA